MKPFIGEAADSNRTIKLVIMILMQEYLAEFLTVALVHILAVASPGPDFVVVSQYSLTKTRELGIYSAFGVALGIVVHIVYSLAGIGFLISKSVLLFSIVKFVGAGYLIYIGIKSLKAKKTDSSSEEIKVAPKSSRFDAVKVGFLTNVLNPKATLFFLSLFTQVISPSTPFKIQFIYGLYLAIMTFVWFSGLALVLTVKTVKQKFTDFQHYIEKTMGGILVALGIKIAMASSK